MVYCIKNIMNIILKNNRWEFIKRVWKHKALCKCRCWNKKEIYLHHYKNWASKSCGCLQKEASSKSNTTHWLSNTKIENTRKRINQRCTNKNIKEYKDYWARWIKVEWKSFEEFLEDMYESFLIHNKKHWWYQTSIDRRNNNWNYCKNNCKWSTMKEQANNKRNNVIN